MTKKLSNVVVSILLAGALVLTGCSGNSTKKEASSAPATTQAVTTEASNGAITVTDMTGNEVKLDGPAKKVVVLTAADCEILYALGAGDTVAGKGEYCDYPAEVADIATVQSGSDTNIEQIIELHPDVVIMSTMAQTKEQVDALKDAGIATVQSDAKDIEGVYKAINLIGSIVGKDAEAKTLVNEMKTAFTDIESKVKTGDSEKAVYFEVSPLEYGLYTAGSGTFMNEIANMLGLKNIFADVDGWAQVSEEQVIERNPDYIVTIAMYFGDGQKPVDEILTRKGWEGIKAIKNNDVFNADSNSISRPGPRLVDATKELYNFLYSK